VGAFPSNPTVEKWPELSDNGGQKTVLGRETPNSCFMSYINLVYPSQQSQLLNELGSYEEEG